MEEIWKDIPNYEGIYEASNYGRIRTCNGKTTYSVLHGERKWKQRILKYKKGESGYRVTLWKDKKPKDYLVARLICTTFLENLIDTKMTVNHKDGNRLNNNINNLEWLSLADNIRHGFQNNLYHTQYNTKLISKKDGSEFVFNSMSEASKFLKRNSGYISNIILNGNNVALSNVGEEYYCSVDIKKG